MNKTELAEKIKFVEGINKAFQESSTNRIFDKIEYKVFEGRHENITFFQEFLVVTFTDGTISVRNCNCNSLDTIFKEAGKLINGDYFLEVENYEYFLNNQKELEL